ncbi:type II toxin-antitoxin system VapC family toxin [Synechocystis salina LEGE 06155]|nr:type II toxin-antitoxin system VapC family toxin [Synechocystis salina LEGE 06155]
MYLLDTNHCSRIIFGEPSLIRKIANINPSQITTCVIVQGELTYMVEKSQQREANLERLADFLQDISIYFIDDKTAEFYGKLKSIVFQHFAPKNRTKRRNTTMSNLGFYDNDLWIAAIALQNNLTIVSADRDFIRIQEAQNLALESWLKSPNL